MELDELRNKWTEFLSASISAKYGNSEKDKVSMIEKLEEFDRIWEVYKNEHKSQTGECDSGKVDQVRVSM